MSEERVARIADVQFRTGNYGDWNVAGWFHPMTQRYEVRAVYFERDGVRKGFAVVMPTFECSVSREFHGVNGDLRPSVPLETAAWQIEAFGTPYGELSILTLKRACGTYNHIRVMHLFDLEMAFTRFLGR